MIKYLNQIYKKLVKKDAKMETNNNQPFMYTDEQLMSRLKFFIGICLALTLTGIVFVVLYSIIFVTQPLNAISPIDSKFFELIIPIATFLTGTLSGIMLAGNNKEAQAEALKAANSGWDRTPTTPAPNTPSPSGFSASFDSGNIGFNKAPSATSFMPAAAGAAVGAATVGVVSMSSTGKPMPIQDEEPEL
jgi:hypothetical protein